MGFPIGLIASFARRRRGGLWKRGMQAAGGGDASGYSINPRSAGLSQGEGYLRRGWPKPWVNRTSRVIGGRNLLNDQGQFSVQPGGTLFQHNGQPSECGPGCSIERPGSETSNITPPLITSVPAEPAGPVPEEAGKDWYARKEAEEVSNRLGKLALGLGLLIGVGLVAALVFRS
jgi:hypothetical protein